MKRLNELFMQDKFKFAKQEREKIGLKENDVFTVLVKYGPGKPRGILVKNLSRKEENRELPGDFLIIPEPGNRQGKVMTEEEAEEYVKNLTRGKS